MRIMYERIQSGEFKNTYPYPDTRYYKSNGWDDKLLEEREQYRKGETDVYTRFKIAALKEVGLQNHPNADDIYAYAWDKGHSGGLYEVYQELDSLSDLIHTIE